MPLNKPPSGRFKLKVQDSFPSPWFRITKRPATEPYFGRTGGYRFDAPNRDYGVCYAGSSFLVAFAETVLHDAQPIGGEYRIPHASLIDRFVLELDASLLKVADLTGAALKRLGGHQRPLSAEIPYDMPQQWSQAVYDHSDQVDGLAYVSRHMNTEVAYALFDRCAPRFIPILPMALVDHPNLSEAIDLFGVTLF